MQHTASLLRTSFGGGPCGGDASCDEPSASEGIAPEGSMAGDDAVLGLFVSQLEKSYTWEVFMSSGRGSAELFAC
jgi:hypothetical protein